MEACVPALSGFSLDKRAGVPERAKASVLSRPRTPTVAEFNSSDLLLSVLLIAKRKRASKGVTERKRRHERRDCRERRTTCLALDRAKRKRSVRAEVPDCQGSSAFRLMK
jgi:hypothetical protein